VSAVEDAILFGAEEGEIALHLLLDRRRHA
jgi:hypothetical protein